MALAVRSGSTRRYRRLRAFVLRRDGKRCVRCKAVTSGSNVTTSYRRTAGGLDTPSNCRTLCQTCHDLIHGR